MSYAIVGFGNVGQTLARIFACKKLAVSVASSKAPDLIAEKAKAIGPEVTAKSLDDAIKADTILLAVPFWAHRDVAKAAADWKGKTIIDVTNSYGIEPQDLGNLPSSAVVAKAFKGAQLVKAFNSLSAEMLAKDPVVHGAPRVIFMASDEDESATKPVADLIEKLGFAPILLGKLAEGGQLIQAHGKSWAPLIFQELVKLN